MKILLIAATGLSILLVSALLLMPISAHFARYLWWRLTGEIAVINGDVFSRDTKIHYTVYGQGKPILLLHGGLSNKLSWFSQLPELSEGGYQVILLDSRGHGLSGLGKGKLDYRLLADDALAVLDQLRLKRVDILGWSDGANTAFVLAGQWPDRVDKVIAISGNYSTQGLTAAARQENLNRKSGITYWLYRIWTGAEEGFGELEKRLKSLWGSGAVVSDKTLAEIRAPVLIIVGSNDVVTVEHAQDMTRRLSNGTLHIIHDGGHATLITDADEVNRLILKFLDRQADICSR